MEPRIGAVLEPQNGPEGQPPPVSPRPDPVVSPPAVNSTVPASVSAKRREVERILNEAQAEMSVLKQQDSSSTDLATRRKSSETPDEMKASVSMFIPFDNKHSTGAKKPPRRLQAARKATGSSAVRSDRSRGRAQASARSRGRGRASKRTTRTKTKPGAAVARGSQPAKVPGTALAEGVPNGSIGAEQEADGEASSSRRKVQSSPTRNTSISPPAQSPTQPASGSPTQKVKGGATRGQAHQGKTLPPRVAVSGSAKKKSKAARNVEAIAARRKAEAINGVSK